MCSAPDSKFMQVYVVYKDKKEFTADMKNIYNAPNKEVAAAE